MKIFDAFISYASEDKDFVLPLAQKLQSLDLEIWLDKFCLQVGNSLRQKIEQGLSRSRFGIVILSPHFCQKQWPQKELSALFSREINGKNVILPIWKGITKDQVDHHFPLLADKYALQASEGVDHVAQELFNVITSNHQYSNSIFYEKFIPPVGPPPVTLGGHPAPLPSRWDNAWIAKQQNIAFAGLRECGNPAFMEIRMTLNNPHLDISHSELLRVAAKAVIHTLGWPLGVVLNNSPKDRPKPRTDGICAEINMGNRFDYWAIRKDGTFYLLKSLYEDAYAPQYIFFNNRIVRITEALLYADRLYSGFGVSPDLQISIGMQHAGLEGCILSAEGNRKLSYEYKATENEVCTEIETSLEEIKTNLVDIVQKFTQPLFIIFDFFEVNSSVLQDIVNKFLAGENT